MSKQALIIEDDTNSARVLAHLLAKQNVESYVVSDITQFKHDVSIDVIFVDLEMPRKNGYQVLQVLQNNPKYDSIPIIASSVHVGEVKHVQESGFHGFISKPLSKDKFPEQLQRIFAGESIWEIT